MRKISADLFASAYVRHNCNGVRALRAMGNKSSPEAAAVTASRLLRNAKVQEALAELRKKADMDALEVVARMSDMARASLEDFLDRDGRVDLAKARRRGKLHLIQHFRQGSHETEGGVTTETTLKLYDAQAALKTMMEYHGLLSDILEIRRLPKDPAELRQFIKERLPLLFEDPNDPKKVH
jgi:hypothetical protein